MLINVTFQRQYGELLLRGGGMYNSSSSPTIRNTIFWGNLAPSGGRSFTITAPVSPQSATVSSRRVSITQHLHEHPDLKIPGLAHSGIMAATPRPSHSWRVHRRLTWGTLPPALPPTSAACSSAGRALRTNHAALVGGSAGGSVPHV